MAGPSQSATLASGAGRRRGRSEVFYPRRRGDAKIAAVLRYEEVCWRSSTFSETRGGTWSVSSLTLPNLVVDYAWA